MAALSKPPLFVVATDGSRPAEKAVSAAIAKAKAEGAELRVVTVVDVELLEAPSLADATLPGHEEALEAAAHRVAATAAASARAAGVRAGSAVVRSLRIFDPAAAIASDAKKHKAALVVVGSHGRSGVDRLLLGSVAERVAGLAHCPVLIVR